jgi:hypothetical protein
MVEMDGKKLIASSYDLADGSMMVGVGTETLDVDDPDFMEMMIDEDGKIDYFTLPIGLDKWERSYRIKPTHYGKMKTQNETNEAVGGDFIRTDGEGKYAESFVAESKMCSYCKTTDLKNFSQGWDDYCMACARRHHREYGAESFEATSQDYWNSRKKTYRLKDWISIYDENADEFYGIKDIRISHPDDDVADRIGEDSIYLVLRNRAVLNQHLWSSKTYDDIIDGAESFSADGYGELITTCPYCDGKKIDDHDKYELVECFKRYLEDSTPHPDAEENQIVRDNYYARLGYTKKGRRYFAESFGAEYTVPKPQVMPSFMGSFAKMSKIKQQRDMQRRLDGIWRMGDGDEVSIKHIYYSLGALGAGRDWHTQTDYGFEMNKNDLVQRMWWAIQAIRDELGLEDFKELVLSIPNYGEAFEQDEFTLPDGRVLKWDGWTSYKSESFASYDMPISERQRYRIRKLGGRIDKAMNRSDASQYIKSLMAVPLHAETADCPTCQGWGWNEELDIVCDADGCIGGWFSPKKPSLFQRGLESGLGIGAGIAGVALVMGLLGGSAGFAYEEMTKRRD